MRIAWLLPPKVLLWAFIRAYSLDGNGPGSEYKRVYDMVVKKYKIDEHKL
jgi:hypothetical protein